MSGIPSPPFFLWIDNFFRLILGFLPFHKNKENSVLISLNHLWGTSNGMAVNREANRGSTFILSTSALPHSDKGRFVHLFKSSLTVFNNLGPFNSKMLSIGDVILTPRYRIPSVFQTIGVELK